MQGAGNDFVLLDNRNLNLSEEDIAELAPAICERKFGVGADGILGLSSPQLEAVDYTMLYRNPDGSPAGMCGNGARCIALFAHSLGFDKQHRFNVHEQIYEASITNSNTASIGFPMETSVQERSVADQELFETFTGTEHIVKQVNEEQLENKDQLVSEGRKLRYHQDFAPEGTNVNFICGNDTSSLELQTYERGVEDLTLACGTGAIASALAWHHIQEMTATSNIFSVETKGGKLDVGFSYYPDEKKYSNITLKGPAHFVFQGNFLQ